MQNKQSTMQNRQLAGSVTKCLDRVNTRTLEFLMRRWCSTTPSMLSPSGLLSEFCNTTQSDKTVTDSCLIGTGPSSLIHCSQGYEQLSDGWQESHKHTTSDRCCFLALLENTLLLSVKWKSSARRQDLPLCSMVLHSYLARSRSPLFPTPFGFFKDTSNTSQLQLMARRVEAAPRHTPSLLPASYLQVFLDPFVLLCFSGALLLAAVLDGGLWS